MNPLLIKLTIFYHTFSAQFFLYFLFVINIIYAIYFSTSEVCNNMLLSSIPNKDLLWNLNKKNLVTPLSKTDSRPAIIFSESKICIGSLLLQDWLRPMCLTFQYICFLVSADVQILWLDTSTHYLILAARYRSKSFSYGISASPWSVSPVSGIWEVVAKTQVQDEEETICQHCK